MKYMLLIHQGDKTLTTDGPFVAVQEALGGYLFYEALKES